MKDQLPPVLPPIGAKLRFTQSDLYCAGEESGTIVEVTRHDKKNGVFYTTTTLSHGDWEFQMDDWQDGLELVSPIALANGIGVDDKIITRHDVLPIPIRSHDWTATREGYEPGHPVGKGETEEGAIADLKDQESEPTSDYCESEAAKADAPEYHGGFMSPERAQKLESDLAAARAENEKWIEKEALCCPEDVGFPEYIGALESSEHRLRAALEEAIKLIKDQYQWEPITAESRETNEQYSGTRRNMPTDMVELDNQCGIPPEEMADNLNRLEAALAPASSGKGEA